MIMSGTVPSLCHAHHQEYLKHWFVAEQPVMTMMSSFHPAYCHRFDLYLFVLIYWPSFQTALLTGRSGRS